MNHGPRMHEAKTFLLKSRGLRETQQISGLLCVPLAVLEEVYRSCLDQKPRDLQSYFLKAVQRYKEAEGLIDEVDAYPYVHEYCALKNIPEEHAYHLCSYIRLFADGSHRPMIGRVSVKLADGRDGAIDCAKLSSFVGRRHKEVSGCQ